MHFRGLNYCHCCIAKPLVHADIKPGNILLDLQCEPKIGDFGLSVEAQSRDKADCLNRAFGTRPYTAPEFISKRLLSPKIDVFSFGVVLLELATGLRCADEKRKQSYLYKHMACFDPSSDEALISIMDSSTPKCEDSVELCRLMIKLGKDCTNLNPNNRPNMLAVYNALNEYKPAISVSKVVCSSIF